MLPYWSIGSDEEDLEDPVPQPQRPQPHRACLPSTAGEAALLQFTALSSCRVTAYLSAGQGAYSAQGTGLPGLRPGMATVRHYSPVRRLRWASARSHVAVCEDRNRIVADPAVRPQWCGCTDEIVPGHDVDAVRPQSCGCTPTGRGARRPFSRPSPVVWMYRCGPLRSEKSGERPKTGTPSPALTAPSTSSPTPVVSNAPDPALAAPSIIQVRLVRGAFGTV